MTRCLLLRIPGEATLRTIRKPIIRRSRADDPAAPAIVVSPERLAVSVLFGSVSFLVGLPGLPGLLDNALIGVVSTLLPLFRWNDTALHRPGPHLLH